MMTSIEFIRKYKEPRAKIGLRVTYAGHPYRIANTSGDGLKLRSEILCHAKDDLLDYEPAKGIHNATLYNKAQRLQTQLIESQAREAAAIAALEKLADWLNLSEWQPELSAEYKRFIREWDYADELVNAWKARQVQAESEGVK